jgi:hypothetical protein
LRMHNVQKGSYLITNNISNSFCVMCLVSRERIFSHKVRIPVLPRYASLYIV